MGGIGSTLPECIHSGQIWLSWVCLSSVISFNDKPIGNWFLPQVQAALFHSPTYSSHAQCFNFRIHQYRSRFQSFRFDHSLNSCGNSECSDEDDFEVCCTLTMSSYLGPYTCFLMSRTLAPPLYLKSTTAVLWRVTLPTPTRTNTKHQTSSLGLPVSKSSTTMVTAGSLPLQSHHRLLALTMALSA